MSTADSLRAAMKRSAKASALASSKVGGAAVVMGRSFGSVAEGGACGLRAHASNDAAGCHRFWSP